MKAYLMQPQQTFDPEYLGELPIRLTESQERLKYCHFVIGRKDTSFICTSVPVRLFYHSYPDAFEYVLAFSTKEMFEKAQAHLEDTLTLKP